MYVNKSSRRLTKSVRINEPTWVHKFYLQGSERKTSNENVVVLLVLRGSGSESCFRVASFHHYPGCIIILTFKQGRD